MLKKMSREEERFARNILGWLGGDSFVKSTLSISNFLISTNDNGSLVADLRWKTKQFKKINGVIIEKGKTGDYQMTFTSFDRHDHKKRPFLKKVKKIDNVLQRQIPDLFESTTGFNISALKD